MKKRAGFTLIEAIMTMVLTGIVALVFAVVIHGSIDSWLFLRSQKRMQQDASSTLHRMVREIKRTRGTSDIDILTFTATRYQFRDMNNNLIDYQKIGSNLNRNSAILLDNLPADGLELVYFDKNGAVTAEKSEIRIMRIILKTVSGNNTIRLQGAAGLRVR